MELVIDNFFDDPDWWRDVGLKLISDRHDCILRDEKNNYPGVRVKLPPDLVDILRNKLCEHFDSVCNLDASFHLTTRIHGTGFVHRDGGNDHAGLIYLTPNPPENSGTSLYSYDDFEEYSGETLALFWKASRAKKLDLGCLEEWQREKDYHRSKNTLVKNIENVYNRFVSYPAQHPHAPNQYFGNNLFNARLTIVFWFDDI